MSSSDHSTARATHGASPAATRPVLISLYGERQAVDLQGTSIAQPRAAEDDTFLTVKRWCLGAGVSIGLHAALVALFLP